MELFDKIGRNCIYLILTYLDWIDKQNFLTFYKKKLYLFLCEISKISDPWKIIYGLPIKLNKKNIHFAIDLNSKELIKNQHFICRKQGLEHAYQTNNIEMIKFYIEHGKNFCKKFIKTIIKDKNNEVLQILSSKSSQLRISILSALSRLGAFDRIKYIIDKLPESEFRLDFINCVYHQKRIFKFLLKKNINWDQSFYQNIVYYYGTMGISSTFISSGRQNLYYVDKYLTENEIENLLYRNH